MIYEDLMRVLQFRLLTTNFVLKAFQNGTLEFKELVGKTMSLIWTKGEYLHTQFLIAKEKSLISYMRLMINFFYYSWYVWK